MSDPEQLPQACHAMRRGKSSNRVGQLYPCTLAWKSEKVLGTTLNVALGELARKWHVCLDHLSALMSSKNHLDSLIIVLTLSHNL